MDESGETETKTGERGGGEGRRYSPSSGPDLSSKERTPPVHGSTEGSFRRDDARRHLEFPKLLGHRRTVDRSTILFEGAAVPSVPFHGSLFNSVFGLFSSRGRAKGSSGRKWRGEESFYYRGRRVARKIDARTRERRSETNPLFNRASFFRRIINQFSKTEFSRREARRTTEHGDKLSRATLTLNDVEESFFAVCRKNYASPTSSSSSPLRVSPQFCPGILNCLSRNFQTPHASFPP